MALLRLLQSKLQLNRFLIVCVSVVQYNNKMGLNVYSMIRELQWYDAPRFLFIFGNNRKRTVKEFGQELITDGLVVLIDGKNTFSNKQKLNKYHLLYGTPLKPSIIFTCLGLLVLCRFTFVLFTIFHISLHVSAIHPWCVNEGAYSKLYLTRCNREFLPLSN